ncbi:tetratricopeptide repeat protein [Thalassoroseus pseudoceratinae]|uniref:tetratricopeptide repeat protein n=1 Tax=Thalassoroseus pseudoceratinae TaxID=2713176 RepID=UPI0019806790|nr:tetratricopeptide repeat protein [Thalassoroseus pseudoceratinae]
MDVLRALGQVRVRGWLVVAIFCLVGGNLAGCHWLQEFCDRSCNEARILAEKAHQAECNGNLDQAYHYLRQAVETNPDDPELHREVARLAIDRGDSKAAIEYLRFATTNMPDDSESFVTLARLLEAEGRQKDAVAALNAALVADPMQPTALLKRADYAEKADDPELASEIYHRLLAVDSHHTEAQIRLASLQINAGRPSEAAPLLRAAAQSPIATAEQRQYATWSLGIAYGQLERWSDAATTLASAADSVSGEVSADDWYRIAYARHRSGDIPGTKAGLERVFRLNPGHEAAHTMANSLRLEVPAPDGIRRIGHSVSLVPPPPPGWLAHSESS